MIIVQQVKKCFQATDKVMQDGNAAIIYTTMLAVLNCHSNIDSITLSQDYCTWQLAVLDAPHCHLLNEILCQQNELVQL